MGNKTICLSIAYFWQEHYMDKNIFFVIIDFENVVAWTVIC